MVTVPASYGDTTIVINFSSKLDIYDKYRFILAIRPVGGNWETNITKEEAYFKVVEATTSTFTVKDNLIVYPNPFNNQFNFTNKGDIQSFSINNLNDQQLFSSKACRGLNTVDLKNRNKGMYLLNLSFSNAESTAYKIDKN